MFLRVFSILFLCFSAVAFSQENHQDMTVGSVANDTTENLPKYSYDNRMIVFNLFRLNYERIKPNALYVGVDVWATYAKSSSNFEYRKHFGGAIWEGEFDMGYNFLLNRKDRISPFLGLGVFKDCHSYAKKIKMTEERYYYIGNVRYDRSYIYSRYKSFHLPVMFYGAAGFKYNHEFNSIVNLGTNFKLLIGGNFAGQDRWSNPKGGFECGIPLTLRFGKDRHWDFCFEPFDIFLINRDFYLNYVGFHLSFGYRY